MTPAREKQTRLNPTRPRNQPRLQKHRPPIKKRRRPPKVQGQRKAKASRAQPHPQRPRGSHSPSPWISHPDSSPIHATGLKLIAEEEAKGVGRHMQVGNEVEAPDEPTRSNLLTPVRKHSTRLDCSTSTLKHEKKQAIQQPRIAPNGIGSQCTIEEVMGAGHNHTVHNVQEPLSLLAIPENPTSPRRTKSKRAGPQMSQAHHSVPVERAHHGAARPLCIRSNDPSPTAP